MDYPRLDVLAKGVVAALLGVAAPLAGVVEAGGHHRQTVYVPVQPVGVATVPLQAAAPVSYFQLQAAAPAVQYVQLQAAAPVQVIQATAVAPVAAAPTGQVIQITIGGSAPAPDGLSPEQKDRIIRKLEAFNLALPESITLKARRHRLRKKAEEYYVTETGDEVGNLDADEKKFIDTLVASVLRESPTPAPAPTPTPTTYIQQPVLAPVAVAAPPLQLFLPVKVKHHGLRHNPY